MSIYKKVKQIIAQYPAYDVVEREASYKGAVQIDEQDLLCLDTKHTKHYRPFSVMGYAMENGECPIAAYERTLRHQKEHPYAGHEVYGLIQQSSMITAEKQPHRTYVAVSVGQEVLFLGKVFVIYQQNNDNLGLKEVTK